MADNVSVSSAATVAVAARVGTYSGDASQVAQAVVPVIATGSDDSKTLTDIAPALAGLDSTGGGIQACAMVAQLDDASTTTVTENQFAHPRISSRRALLVEGVASGTAVGTTESQYVTEDAAAAANPVGPIINVRRRDTLTAAEVSTDGDVIAVNATSKGELYVKQTDAVPVTDNSGSLTVDNGGTFAVQATLAAGAASIGKAEDVASVDADVGVPAMAVRKATPANTSGTDGDYEMLQMAAGRLWASADITIGGTAVDGNSGNKSAQTQRVVIATDQPNLTTALNTQGDVAHDGVNAGSPIQNGAEAIAHGANPTAVAAADRTKVYANRAGIPFVIGGHPNIFTYQIHTTGALTDQAMGPAIGSGLKMVVTQMQVVTDNACTAFPAFRAGFGATNTPGNGSTTGQAGVVLSHPGLPAGGGISRGDGSGILGIGADGEELRVTCGAPTGGSLDVTMSGYTIES